MKSLMTTAFVLFLMTSAMSARAAQPAEWHWPVPSSHAWSGKPQAPRQAGLKPVLVFPNTIHENGYVFVDFAGHAVMITGPRVEYFDFKEFLQQHQVTEQKRTSEGVRYKFTNNYTGKSVTLDDLRVVSPPPTF